MSLSHVKRRRGMGAGTDLSVMLPEKGISGINGGIPRILKK
jgi:hypothetical protein